MQEEPYVVGVLKNGWVYAGPLSNAQEMPKEMLSADLVLYPSRSAALYTAMTIPVITLKPRPEAR